MLAFLTFSIYFLFGCFVICVVRAIREENREKKR